MRRILFNPAILSKNDGYTFLEFALEGKGKQVRSSVGRALRAAAPRYVSGSNADREEAPTNEPKVSPANDSQAGAGTCELKSCDLRPTAEEMFGRFMVAVAGRPLSVHQPVNEIGDTAERLTAEWLARKDKFAAK